jgi:hypothetical protein
MKVATIITFQLNEAGGGNTSGPMRIAAVRRASRYNISGKGSLNSHHNATCTTVATIPEMIPAPTAAPRLNDMRLWDMKNHPGSVPAGPTEQD